MNIKHCKAEGVQSHRVHQKTERSNKLANDPNWPEVDTTSGRCLSPLSSIQHDPNLILLPLEASSLSASRFKCCHTQTVTSLLLLLSRQPAGPSVHQIALPALPLLVPPLEPLLHSGLPGLPAQQLAGCGPGNGWDTHDPTAEGRRTTTTVKGVLKGRPDFQPSKLPLNDDGSNFENGRLENIYDPYR